MRIRADVVSQGRSTANKRTEAEGSKCRAFSNFFALKRALGSRLAPACELPLAHGLWFFEEMIDVIYRVPEGMKMVSMRLTDEEVQHIDSRAAAVNLSRTSYIRMRLREEGSSPSSELLVEILDALRQMIIMLDMYLSILERLVKKLEYSDNDDVLHLIAEEIKRSRGLTDLIFKSQKHLVRALRESRNVNGS